MQLLKLAVIGTGALGRHHARILAGLSGVQLVGVADLNAASGQAVAQSCRTQWVPDYRELLDKIDAAVVAVPTAVHRDVARYCLERHIPVLVEKPIASDTRQAEELVRIAERRSTLLQVGHVERFNPAWTAAAPFLAGPVFIRAERFSAYAFRSMDIGVVHDVMIHDLDLVLSIVRSPLLRVEALGTTIVGGQEDCMQARLTFENGCIADLCANRVSPMPRRTMQVFSFDGCTSIDFTTRDVVHYSQSAALRYGPSLPERANRPGANLDQMRKDVFGTEICVKRPVVSAADALTEELGDFIECVRTGRRPRVTGREALTAMRVAEQVLKSATEQRDALLARRTPIPIRKAA